MKLDLAKEILNTIFVLRNVSSTNNPSFQAKDSFEYHLHKIQSFVDQKAPIQLVLPAFPAKSSNPEKTLGTFPDYGEVLALKRLQQLCSDIKKIYAPGAHLIICSDGRVFSDLVQVSDDAVNTYTSGVEEIIDQYKFKDLSTYNLEDAFQNMPSFDDMRKILATNYAEPLEVVRQKVLSDFDFENLFNGIHRFLFEDLLVLKPDLSKNQVRKLSKDLAYKTIQRSNAWSNFIEQKFPQAVRLSIHPQPLHSQKIGVQLLPSNNFWRTPWHSALIFDGKVYSLVRRKDAEDMKATLQVANGKYPYFVISEGVA